MAATEIISKYRQGKLWQTGVGEPEHNAPLYTVFTDQLTSKEYIALDEEGTWAQNSQLIHFDDVNKTYQFATGVSTQKVQIGQEQFMLMHVTSAIAEGVPVTLGPWDNDCMCFEAVVARADDPAKADIVGITTTSTNGAGIVAVTLIGKINNFNTLGYSSNALLYLAPTGGLTNIKPTAPNKVRLVAKVGDSASNGTIWIGKFWNEVDYQQIMVDTGEPNGFTPTQKENVSLSYNPSTRLVTVSGTFYYYNKSLLYTKTGTATVTHADSTGLHFVYYVGDVLTTSTTIWDLALHTPIAVAVFNNNVASTYWAGPSGFLLDERHGTVMDHATHQELHDVIGCYAQNQAEFALSGTYSVATGSGGIAANTFGVAAGTVKDEDCLTLLTALTDNAGVGSRYYCWYNLGGVWYWYLNNLPYFVANTNMLINSSGALTELTGTDVYANVYVIGQPRITTGYDFIFLQPQATFTSLAAAQAESQYALNLTGLAGPELAFLWRITYRRNNSYDDAGGNVRIESTMKLVGTRYVAGGVNVGGGGGGTTDHTLLTNRDAANQHPASAIQVTLDTTTTATLQDYLNVGRYSTGTYGETITIGDNLYLGSDSKLYKANASVVGTMGVIGKATQSGVLNDVKSYLICGIYTYGSPHGLTPIGSGGRIFASTTSGLSTMSAPSLSGNIVQVLGCVLSTTQIRFEPSQDFYEIG